MLLQNLIGKGNLKEYSLSGNKGYIRLPENVKRTILSEYNRCLNIINTTNIYQA